MAASLTAFTNQPVDTIRTRLVTQGEPRVYSGILDAVKKIYTNEGVRGYYRGLVPCLLLITPETAFRFGIYQFLNNNWQTFTNYIKSVILNDAKQTKYDAEIGVLQSSINGSLAGVASKTIVYPFDLAKKRLQIQGFDEARIKFGKVGQNIFSFKPLNPII